MKKSQWFFCLTKFFRAQSTIFNWMGLRAFPKQGFYIPYRYAKDVDSSHQGNADLLLCAWLKEEFDTKRNDFCEVLEKAQKYNNEFERFHQENKDKPNQPRFNQEWFTGLDGAITYTMVRELKPKKIIEIGSGHSTRFLSQAIHDGEMSCQLHSIDPQPRKDIDKICDKISRHTVTDVAMDELTALESNDILFIDCSHIFVDGSDVDYLFTQVLPQLKSGVCVHIHDIFLPYGYPEEWQWRGYNEQNALLAMLGARGRYQVICPNAYLRKHHSDIIETLNIVHNQNTYEASFWLKIN